MAILSDDGGGDQASAAGFCLSVSRGEDGMVQPLKENESARLSFRPASHLLSSESDLSSLLQKCPGR